MTDEKPLLSSIKMRVALRREGGFINAYLPLSSLAVGLAKDTEAYDLWLATLKRGVEVMLRNVMNVDTPINWEIESASENERGGKA